MPLKCTIKQNSFCSIAEAQKTLPGSVFKPERIRMEDKSVQPSRPRNFITFRRTLRLHLFNCGRRTYELDPVVDLFAALNTKLDFDPVVEKHYFSLAEMSEMTTNVIPKLQVDMAFFVVHAHESRLSINEDNAGIGYAKIYRALLAATGESV